MKATDFEFRNRFWIFGVIFGVGFWLYALDRVNSVQYLVNATVGANSPHAETLARCALAFAALLLLLTALLRTWATSYLRSDVMQDNDLRAEKVVASGPYRHVRNPLYLGNILMAIGMGLLASRLGFVVIVLGITIFCLRLIGLEESNLQKEQGESYVEFCRRVPRLWPSLEPRLPDSGLMPHWKQAFIGELFMWGFFAAVTVFAVTLNAQAMWITMAVSIVLYIASSYLISAQKKSNTPS
jgi:protein-S-isoprenylcysteine O-methyltransferase Ste14